MLKGFCQWMEDNISGVALGESLFCGHRPEKAPANCTAVLNHGGIGDVHPIQPGFGQHRIQLLTRHEHYHAGLREICRIFRALVTPKTINIEINSDSTDACTLNSVQGTYPKYIGQDAKGRFEFSSNLIVTTTEDT
jgi:hypothetical protein